jgi:hypothetical protein
LFHKKFAFALMLAVAASLMLAGGAMAKSRDRNHDRIPDRWEKKFHLSLHKKQGGRDQDHDGLKNRAEFKAHLNPRDADTDNDGVKDGAENTGTVDSFENGVLTIKLVTGKTLSGNVDDNTEIQCDPTAGDDRGHDEGDDNNDQGDDNNDQGDDNHDQGDDNHDQGDDNGGHGGDRSVKGGDDNQDEDPGDDDTKSCGTEALTPGAKVLEADLHVVNGDAFWESVELLTP